jgi:hypothetical protein
VSYPGAQRATGGSSVSSIGGYTIHIFQSSSNFVA